MMNTRWARPILIHLCWLGLPLSALAQGTLIWSDEFDGTTIDPANWEYMIGDGTIDLSDFVIFAGVFGTGSTNSPPNCG